MNLSTASPVARSAQLPEPARKAMMVSWTVDNRAGNTPATSGDRSSDHPVVAGSTPITMTSGGFSRRISRTTLFKSNPCMEAMYFFSQKWLSGIRNPLFRCGIERVPQHIPHNTRCQEFCAASLIENAECQEIRIAGVYLIVVVIDARHQVDIRNINVADKGHKLVEILPECIDALCSRSAGESSGDDCMSCRHSAAKHRAHFVGKPPGFDSQSQVSGHGIEPASHVNIPGGRPRLHLWPCT